MRSTSLSFRHLVSLLILTGSVACVATVANAADASVAAPATSVSAGGVNKTGVSASDFETMKKNVASAGITFTQTPGNLDIVLDEATLLASFPALVKAGAVAKVTDADIKSAPLSVSIYAAGVTFSVTILSGVYAKDPALDKLHVNLTVIPSDSKDKQSCFSFDFTRAMYEKLDLNTTTTNDFMTKTPGFTFSEWCKTNLEKEDKALTSAKKPA
jgi:hypothetical protein